jgi:hypothetical protein
LQSEGRKPKPPGHGLAKQLSQYRPQIEARRAAEQAKRAAAKERRAREKINAQIRRHALYVQEINNYRLKIGETAVENAGGLFLDLPFEVQVEYVDKSKMEKQRWEESGYAELGAPFDPFAPYHS